MRAALPFFAAAVVSLLAACASTRSEMPSGPPGRITDRDKMVKVPEITCELGYDQGEQDEAPKHEVKLKAFLIDKYEVTNSDYKSCVSSNVCGGASGLADPKLSGSSQPVVGVSWFDADKYCRWAEKRLPTEAEWERVARGGELRQYPWGPRFEDGKANVAGDADGYKATAPVGSFKEGVPKELPVYDLAGNAAEWVQDWYDPSYYRSQETFENPQGPDAHTGERISRGGSYLDPPGATRASARNRLEVNMKSNAIGFRCAADL